MDSNSAMGRTCWTPAGSTRWAREGWRTLVAAAAVGLLSASAAWAWAAADARSDPTAAEIAAFDERFPPRELPREWRWQGRQYRFDPMFRQR